MAMSDDESLPKIIRREYGKGNVYVGEHNKGIPHGKGEFRYNNGDIYRGAFENGFKQGKGEYRYKNGNFYEGEFKDNLINGKGKYRYKNGSVYEGEFKKGKKHGQGKYNSKNGSVYEGGYENDLYHGNGVYTLNNGDFYKGEFKKGEIYNPTLNKKDQTVLLINKDERLRNINSLKQRYKKVELLEKSSTMNANFLKELITHSTKGDNLKKKLKIVIFEHSDKKGELSNQNFILETFNKTLKEVKEYNKENFDKPVKRIDIVLNVCYGSNVVYKNKKFQEVLKSFTQANITVGVSTGEPQFALSVNIGNNKNSLPKSKTEGYYVINEFSFNEKSDFENIEPYKEKKFKTIADFLEDNYLGKKKSVSETSYNDLAGIPQKISRKKRKTSIQKQSSGKKKVKLK